MSGGRRAFLGQALLAGVWLLTSGHTPYNQWNLYRQKHLLILTSKSDPDGFALGQAIAETLVARLPSSGARVTRAPDLARVASLMSTKQLDIAVLGRQGARAMHDGASPFESYGAVALRVVANFDDYVLVSRDDFPALHGYQVAAALAGVGDHAGDGGVVATAGQPGLAMHDGAATFLSGGAAPEGAD